jgi:uncharacterized RDD family membrane protein YckC
VARRQAERDEAERRLNPVEKSMLRTFVERVAEQLTLNQSDDMSYRVLREHLRALDTGGRPGPQAVSKGGSVQVSEDDEEKVDRVTGVLGVVFASVIAQWPVLWFPLFALMFRGGIARWVAGLALVRRDGRPASVWVCWLRALLTWLPLLLVLLAVIALQVYQPYWVYTRTVLWLFALVLLGLMAFAALRRPDQSPLDRLFRTFIVPA